MGLAFYVVISYEKDPKCKGRISKEEKGKALKHASKKPAVVTLDSLHCCQSCDHSRKGDEINKVC